MIHVEQIRQGRSLPLDWENGVDYVIGDKVVSGLVLYRCKTNHTSSGAFDLTKFDVVSTGGGGGSNGANVDAQSAIVPSSGTTSSSYVDMPSAAITTAALTGLHKYFVVFSGVVKNSQSNRRIYIRIVIGGVPVPGTEIFVEVSGANKPIVMATTCVSAAIASGKIIKVQWFTNGNTASIQQGVLSAIGVP